MRRLGLCLLAVVVLCSGQMCGGPAVVPPAVDPGPDRLVVNDHLRVACAGFMRSDADLESYLMICESDRLAGWDKRSETMTLLATCSGSPYPDIKVDCTTCSTAVIEQIYGAE